MICSPDERHLAKSIASATAAKVLAPITNNVRHAAALIRRCSLLVGNNSGPIHLAAAAGIAVVEISCHPIGGDPYDEVNPARFGAYTENCIVVQPERATEPCVAKCESPSPHCIKKVNWIEVSEAVQALLKRQPTLGWANRAMVQRKAVKALARPDRRGEGLCVKVFSGT